MEATKFTTGKRKSGTAFINEFEPNTNHDSLSKPQCTQNLSNKIYQKGSETAADKTHTSNNGVNLKGNLRVFHFSSFVNKHNLDELFPVLYRQWSIFSEYSTVNNATNMELEIAKHERYNADRPYTRSNK